MTNVGATLRVVKSVHGGPYIHGRHAANKLAGDDGLHGAEEETEDPLVHDPQREYSGLGTSTAASLVTSLMVFAGAAVVSSR
jgi:hypothetical protein